MAVPSDYLTSTLLDLRAGLPLETGPIFHEPLRRAVALGVAAPELARLVTEIPMPNAGMLECRNGAPRSFQHSSIPALGIS